MQVSKREGSTERKILTAMIVNTETLAQISAHWEKNLMRNQWANIIGGWCVRYYEKYEEAPGNAIEQSFNKWAAKQQDKDTIELVEAFLSGLSGEYEREAKQVSAPYMIDLAGDHFNKIRLERLLSEAQDLLENGDVTDAMNMLNESTRVEIGAGAGIDVLNDESAVRQVFESKKEPLIVYPQALESFFGSELERDAFVAFMAPEKRGKSYWLQDMAWRAMRQGQNVAYFQVGDMSQDQVMKRFLERAARRPFKAVPNGKKPVRVPVLIERDPDDPMAQVEFEEVWWDDPMNWKEAWDKCQAIQQKSGGKIKLSCHPNSSINVFGLLAILKRWERKDWIPSVIIIDYADLLAPIHGAMETRDQINATWSHLRALSQSKHCLVVTATQADAASYGAHVMTMSNFSNDKRKFSHVTGMIGINQTIAEKQNQVVRLNWIVRREDDFDTTKCVHVAECRSIGNVSMHSCY